MTSRTWLVTGTSRGLGRALVLAAAESGDQVVATVRTAGTAPTHEAVHEHVLDVRDRVACEAAVEFAVSRLGRLDVLVNNAGQGLVGAVEEVDEPAARDLLDSTFFGSLWLSRSAVRHMRSRGSGNVVQVSSVGGVGTMPLMGLYNSAKWAVEAMSEALAAEVADQGIRVTIVEPGSIDTHWATSSMAFADSLPAYDRLRESLFGTRDVPWPDVSGTGGGAAPREVAHVVVEHVRTPQDDRLRLLVGTDAAAAVAEAMRVRLEDYALDPSFTSARGRR